jgi:hypothetical protein
MNINTAFPSKYLKAGDDVPEDETIVLTIEKVDMETIGLGKDAADKPVLYFEEVDKGMVLNKTNSLAIAKLYGADTDDWVGKRLALFSTYVQFQSEMVLSIRVKPKAPAPAKGKGPRPVDRADVPNPTAAVNDDDEIPF